ncbi:unnamed protein product [Moneuplotes crassus]|uniref:Uncharacterized protein n=1 Tax=Euplotes crassus TaxID=5936 RepID=A0AAD1Y2Y8_EUPCR|nr:unnamed protein product [Moneuplotes crassus]
MSNVDKGQIKKFKYKLKGPYMAKSGDTKNKWYDNQKHRNPAKSLMTKSRNKKDNISSHHYCEISVERYKSRGYAARNSLLEKENAAVSPISKSTMALKRYTRSFSKENQGICSLYKKIQQCESELPSNSETVDNRQSKLALRELQPVMMTNKDAADENSRNRRAIKYSKPPLQSCIRTENTSRQNSRSESLVIFL